MIAPMLSSSGIGATTLLLDVTRTVLADTGPLYAAVDPDDQYHARAQEQQQTFAEDGLSVVLA